MFDLKDWLEILNYVTVIGGVIWAIMQWPKARKQRIETERERSYTALNDHFLKFLELELQAPGLGTSSTDRTLVWNKLSQQDRAKQRTLFDYLSSILERAYYFLYKGKEWENVSDKKKKVSEEWQEWQQWEHWLDRYALNPNFIAFWDHLDDMQDEASYDSEFVAFIKDKINKEKP